jgi:preprotein translocase subunit SecD
MRTVAFNTFFVCGLLLTSCGRQQPTNPSVFQMRLVQDAATADTEQMTILHSLTDATRMAPETLDVQKKVLVDDTAVHSATAQAATIEVVFTDMGRKLFADITRQSVGKRLAIVVDGKLLAAPRIEMQIPGGRAIISGRFSPQAATQLATKINAAAKK